MKKLILFACIFFLCSCSLFENKKKSAIEICQKAKVTFQSENPFVNLLLGSAGLGTNATWLDFANTIAKKDPNKKYDWDAKETKDNNLFLVEFVDENAWGYRWEVDIEQKIVKEVDGNDYLERKYGLSRLDVDSNFQINNIKKNTLKIEQLSSYWEKTKNQIVYVINASVVNKTDKVITSAEIDGKLKLIFKDKTIKGTSDYNSGFKEKISENRPWKPNTARDFFIKTKGIETIYLQYMPEYVIFDVSLKAEDPVGYTFDKDIAEYDLMENWKGIKQASNTIIPENPGETSDKINTGVVDTGKVDTSVNNENGTNYVVLTPRAYFYNTPDSSNRRNGYLIQGEHINSLRDTDGYIYCEFTNQTTKKIIKGWLKKENLQGN